MLFLIIYGALAFVSFIAFVFLTEIAAKDRNEIFKVQVYQVNYFKILVMAVFFPLTWVAAIAHAIVETVKE